MKKAILFILALGFNLFLACNNNSEEKPEVPEVLKRDTTKVVEEDHVNDSLYPNPGEKY